LDACRQAGSLGTGGLQVPGYRLSGRSLDTGRQVVKSCKWQAGAGRSGGPWIQADRLVPGYRLAG
jgi:hypothetical protein